jgi:hypothetical protein
MLGTCMADRGGYNMYTYSLISYLLAYFKYFKKYALTANVSANVLTYFTYVETFVVNAYVFKYFENTKG